MSEYTLNSCFFQALDPCILSINVSSKTRPNVCLQRHWFEKHEWLCYSKQKPKLLLCSYCDQGNSAKGCASLTGQNNNSQVEEKLTRHEQTKAHMTSLTKTRAAQCSQDLPKPKYEFALPNSTNVDAYNYSWPKKFLSLANQLRKNGQLCDVSLNVKTETGERTEIRAHKLVLVCASQYLQSGLRDCSNLDLGQLDVDSEGLRGVLDFVYGQGVIYSTPTQLHKCLNAAVQLRIDYAIQAFDRALYPGSTDAFCKKYATKNLSTTIEINACSEKDDFQVLTCNPETDGDQSNNGPDLKKSEKTCEQNTKVVNKTGRKRRKDKPYSVCQVCCMSFSRKVMLQKHVRQEHGEIAAAEHSKYVCEFCDKTFGRSYKLAEHKRIHTGDRPFLCSQCGKTFTGKDNLAQHFKIHDVARRRKYQCSQCSMSYLNHTALLNHVSAKHSGGRRPHVCETCGKAFAWPQVLNSHRLRHQPAHTKRFQCSQCQWSFHTKHHLQRHMKTHNKVSRPAAMSSEQHTCKHCGTSFKLKTSMVQHEHWCLQNDSETRPVTTLHSAVGSLHLPAHLAHNITPSANSDISTVLSSALPIAWQYSI